MSPIVFVPLNVLTRQEVVNCGLNNIQSDLIIISIKGNNTFWNTVY